MYHSWEDNEIRETNTSMLWDSDDADFDNDEGDHDGSIIRVFTAGYRVSLVPEESDGDDTETGPETGPDTEADDADDDGPQSTDDTEDTGDTGTGDAGADPLACSWRAALGRAPSSRGTRRGGHHGEVRGGPRSSPPER